MSPVSKPYRHQESYPAISHFRTRRNLALLALSVTGLVASACRVASAAPAAPVKAPRPNVLLILADDLGWSDIGCYGSEIATPNIDALAKDGLSFTQFYNSARCSPSRASILTGLAPHEAGFPNLSGVLSDQAVTLPEMLDDAGYSTSMVGKWHLSKQSTPTKRGFQEFYGMLGGSNSYWQEHPGFIRLPADHPSREYKPGEFYSTDAFADYSIDFIDQSRKTGKPWFQYLAFNAAHFPLHAPAKDIAKYEKVYEQGWDKIRDGRLAKQKKLGLVPQNLTLTPRSNVPKNAANTRTGWADKDNPAWDSLPADRRADLARRMAVYGAIVDHMDQAVGRVIKHLKDTGQYDNTLIFFLSDNGACAEWDPFGFDGSSGPNNVLHTGAALEEIGTPASYVSYGSGWANASNTPWRLYKHYAQEGGIRTPMIVHWPQGLKTVAGSRTTQPGAITDFMPTLVQLCGGTYPAERNGIKILPEQGTSLVPIMDGKTIAPRVLCIEHEGNRMVRETDWKLVALKGKPWELYDLSNDPSEMHDLSAAQLQRVAKMSQDWETWANNSMVKARTGASISNKGGAAAGGNAAVASPNLVGKALTITCDVTAQSPGGVILAQGGRVNGYALYLQGGKPVFVVREKETLVSIVAPQAPTGKFSVEAHLEKDGAMTLAINGAVVGRGKAEGLIQVEPKDHLSIGEDVGTAVGDYKPPHHQQGQVENVKVVAN